MGENRLAAFFTDMGKKDPTPSLYKYLDTRGNAGKASENPTKPAENVAKSSANHRR